jgi:hypothetical protein
MSDHSDVPLVKPTSENNQKKGGESGNEADDEFSVRRLKKNMKHSRVRRLKKKKRHHKSHNNVRHFNTERQNG